MSLDLRELKTMDVGQLVKVAGDLSVQNAGGLPYRDLMYKIIRAYASNEGAVIAQVIHDTAK